MIGRHAEVGRARLDHGEDGGEHATNRADLLPALIFRGRHSKEMTKQFVRPVNGVNIHADATGPLKAEDDIKRDGALHVVHGHKEIIQRFAQCGMSIGGISQRAVR